MVSGIPQFFQSIAALPVAKSIQPGQTYAAVVRLQDNVLMLTSGRLQIPLDDGTGLLPGQRVTFQLTTTVSGAQLTITPDSASWTTPGATAQPNLARVLAPILESLGKLELAPRIHGMIPRDAPTTLSSLQPLLTVLLSKRAPGADLDQFSQIIAAAANQSGLGQGTVQAIAQWLGLVPPTDSAAWHALVLRSRAEQAVAARIAAALKAGGDTKGLSSLKESAASLADRLLSDPALLQSLKDDGDLEPFKALASRIQERAMGAELQNLRALDQSYQFIELPVRESHGFNRAQIHTFQDSSGPGRENGAAVYRTVLDLDTTQLGVLWVALQSAGNQCGCHFRVEDPEVLALLEGEASALEAALVDAGFAKATVTATLWDGNRDEALITLLAPYQKLDLEA
jgi:hypothetical protein